VVDERLDTYFGYFDLSRIVFVTTNAMFQSGLLYKTLSHRQIEQLQVISSEFSFYGEKYLSNQLTEARRGLEQYRSSGQMGVWASGLKPDAVRNVNFWEQKFEEHQHSLEAIVTLPPQIGPTRM
jgi:hypothetical protein